MAEVRRLLRQTLVSCYKDNILGIAKGAAYSALLSFFPVLTTLTAILVQANAQAVSRKSVGNCIQRRSARHGRNRSIQLHSAWPAPYRPSGRCDLVVHLGGVRRDDEPDGGISRGIPDPPRTTFLAAARNGGAARVIVCAAVGRPRPSLIVFGGAD